MSKLTDRAGKVAKGLKATASKAAKGVKNKAMAVKAKKDKKK